MREQEAGVTTGEVCRRHGLSEATVYKWKSKYGGMEVSDAKRLKELEDENRRLKKLLAEAMPDNAALKDVPGKKRLKPAARRTAMARLMERHGLSQRRACRLVGIDHSTLRYRAKRADDAAIRTRLRELEQSTFERATPPKVIVSDNDSELTTSGLINGLVNALGVA